MDDKVIQFPAPDPDPLSQVLSQEKVELMKEALSERFHMSQDLLAELNPGKKFDHVGDRINVVNLAHDKQPAKAARVEVDKTRETVKAFAKDGKLIGFYPATVGSEEKRWCPVC